MTKEELIAAANSLPPKEREELVEQLQQSICEGEFTPEDIAEFKRRADAVDRGEMKTHDGEQVMRELFEKLTRAKAG